MDFGLLIQIFLPMTAPNMWETFELNVFIWLIAQLYGLKTNLKANLVVGNFYFQSQPKLRPQMYLQEKLLSYGCCGWGLGKVFWWFVRIGFGYLLLNTAFAKTIHNHFVWFDLFGIFKLFTRQTDAIMRFLSKTGTRNSVNVPQWGCSRILILFNSYSSKACKLKES